MDEVAYDQVCCHAGQAVWQQKRLYDKWTVRRVFTIGDWTMRYYPSAKKCKLDSPWLGPYLVVSIAVWAIGVQLQPDSPVPLVHCQDLKKIPDLVGVVSWLLSGQTEQLADGPVLGTSMVVGSTPGSVASSVSGLLSTLSLPQSTHAPDAGLLVLPLMALVRIVPGHGLHPFSVNLFDAGPVHLASIAHAFDYRVAVLRDGAKSALRSAHFRRAERVFLDDVSLPWGQQVAVMFQILCALVLYVPAAAECLTNFHGVSPDVLLAFKPWGHIDHTGVECGCRSSDRAGLTFMQLYLIILLVSVN